MRKVSIFRWTASLLLIVALLWAALNQRAIYDWWFLRSYTPSAEIESLSDSAHLSTEGQTLFFVSDPQVLAKANFASSCSFSEFNIVVGCYNGRNIFILDIDNNEINDGEIVTAAHEMLHAAYDRLSSSEKDRINELVIRDAKAVDDADVLETIELYRESTDDKEFANELHSILATEVYNLSDELEEYYSQYFNDRTALVDIAQAYDEVFSELEKHAAGLATTLNRLADSINLQGQSLETRFISLESQRALLQSRIDSGEKGAALAAAVDSFEVAVDDYNAAVASYRDDVKRYDKLKTEYAELVVHHEELIRSLDSSIIPVNID